MKGKTLREYRQSKGLSTKYVAEKLGIKPRTLNYKERNNVFNSLQLAMLCSLYEIKDVSTISKLNKIK